MSAQMNCKEGTEKRKLFPTSSVTAVCVPAAVALSRELGSEDMWPVAVINFPF